MNNAVVRNIPYVIIIIGLAVITYVNVEQNKVILRQQQLIRQLFQDAWSKPQGGNHA